MQYVVNILIESCENIEKNRRVFPLSFHQNNLLPLTIVVKSKNVKVSDMGMNSDRVTHFISFIMIKKSTQRILVFRDMGVILLIQSFLY